MLGVENLPGLLIARAFYVLKFDFDERTNPRHLNAITGSIMIA